MKVSRNIFLLTIVFFGMLGCVERSQAAVVTADSCSLYDVRTAIDLAESGDVVSVPTGNCVWNGQLLITKGLSLVGAGIDMTNITFGGSLPMYTRSLKYMPLVPSLDEPFRLSGFSFDPGNLDGQGIAISNTMEEYALTHIRIDHSEFNNPGDIVFTIDGPAYGVVYNNIFNGGASQGTHIDNYAQDTCNDWLYFPMEYGTANNLYYEDNIFNGQYDTLTSCGHGGKYVYRYNDIHVNRPSGSVTPIFDMHGNQTSVPSGSKGGEIYGNEIDSESSITGATMVGLRGGQMLAFFNKLTNFSSVNSYAREEYDNGIGGCSPSIEQQIKNTYFWNNFDNERIIAFSGHPSESGSITSAGSDYIIRSVSTVSYCASACYIYGVRITGGVGVGQFRGVASFSGSRVNITSYSEGSTTWDIVPDETSTYEIVSDCCDNIHRNEEFFEYDPNFNGTSGVGCGTLAIRPSTCRTGVGYWATDQSCTDFTGMVGSNPPAPISGTLYKCTSTNNWEAYYTPFAYPHPLRGESDTIPPAAPNGLLVN